MKRAVPWALLALAVAVVARWMAVPARSLDEPAVQTAATPPTSRLDPKARRAFRRMGIRNALDRYIAGAGLDVQVKERERRRLVVALARPWKAARRIERVSPGSRGAADRRYRRALNETDTLLRSKLGIGVDTFLAAQSAAARPAPVVP